MYQEWDNTYSVVAGFASVVVLAIFVNWAQIFKQESMIYLYKSLRTLVFISSVLFFATPLLDSLTRKVTSSTLKFIVGVLIVIHVSTFDYSAIKQSSNLMKSGRFVFSLNVIYFAAVLLSSRFKNSYKAFVFLLFSAILFAYIPMSYNQSILKYMNKTRTSVVYTIVNAYLLSCLNPAAVFLYLTLLIFISIL